MADTKHILAAAVVVLNEQKEILLMRHPRRGWEIPGGQVEEGESISSAAIREVKEETGIDIEIIKFCGYFQNIAKGICCAMFTGRPIGGECTVTEESLETAYHPIADALELVTWGNFRQRIELCLNEKDHPFFVEW